MEPLGKLRRFTAGLDTSVAVPSDAETIGSAHDITLVSERGNHIGVETTSLGAWMEHGSFALNGLRAAAMC